MGWPQVTVIVLWAISIGIHIAKHGQPMADSSGAPHKFDFFTRSIGVGLWCWLLWAGGFWDG